MALSGSVGSYQEFNYTGNIQKITIPVDGIYKLEVYGAEGGSSAYVNGGKGGYSVGYKQLTKGNTLYICVGGKGSTAHSGGGVRYINGGYNGGGGGNGQYSNHSSGGGATHIATVSGILSSLSSKKDKVLIVAGGGGGGTMDQRYGGTGGGTTGGNGFSNSCTGGSQTAGGRGQYSDHVGVGRQSSGFGIGGGCTTAVSQNHSAIEGSGGGGGWYGGGGHAGVVGGGSEYWQNGCGGAGGSGYIGGVPSFTYNGTTYTPSTSNGRRSGNGYAKITFAALSKIYNLNVDGSVVQTVYLDGVALEQIKFDGVSVFGNP